LDRHHHLVDREGEEVEEDQVDEAMQPRQQGVEEDE
jgi:hypothetical protein